jgi:large subunit ribosomal protein L29
VAKKQKAKTDEIRKLSDADLAKEIEETYQRFLSVRMQMATNQIPNHRELPILKRQIARLKTIRRERELATAGSSQGAG